MFTSHTQDNTIYNLLMAERGVRTQLAGTETMTKAIIHAVLQTRARWDEYIPLWQVIKLQARYNSPLFASHGIDHSIRTAYYMQKLWPRCTPAMLWTALLHDVGYSEYDICPQCQEKIERIRPYVCSNGCNVPTGIYPEFYRANKFLHARLGGNMVSFILKQYPRLFSEEDTAMIVQAIRVHNSDSNENQLYQPRLHGTLLTIGRHNIRRQYVPVHFFQNKCLALLRIADNLDITRARLTKEKRAIFIVLYQRFIEKNPDIALAKRLASIKRLLRKYPPQGNSNILTDIVTNTTEKEFKFTYSLWILRQIYFVRIDWSKNIFDLAIQIHSTDISELKFENNIPVALYQFKRMYEAFQSIWINLKQLSDIVRVSIGGQWHALKDLASESPL